MEFQNILNGIINTIEENDVNDKRLKLKQVLELSKLDHNKEIMKVGDLKSAHIYCKVNKLSGQISGPLIENYIKEKYCMIKNSASLCIGDLQHRDENLEIKVSTGGENNNKFNYVQLRMNHKCSYILTAYHIDESNVDTLGELYIFKLNKADLKKVILNHGGYAHGTKKKLGVITQTDLDDTTNDKEYAIRPKPGDKCWKELLNFRIKDIGV